MFGVKKFAATVPDSPLSYLHLGALRRLIEDGHELSIIPCINISINIGDTPVNAYRRWATHMTAEQRVCQEVGQRILDDPVLNFREEWKSRLPASRPYDRDDFTRLSIDWKQIDGDLEHFVELPVSHIEPGSETDFLTMAERFDLLGELIDRIKEFGFMKVLFGVHHAGETIPKLDRELKGFDGFVTPINPIGVMMFPTKTSAEQAVRGTSKSIYAIKPLAGGRVDPKRAFTYVFSFDVEGCMVGAGSILEAHEDFKIAVEVLENPRSPWSD